MKRSITPAQDAGWGLIYRLNELWRDCERFAPKGQYDEWNFKLDRIWCNLLYRNEMVIVREQGDKDSRKIIDIKLNEEDSHEKEFIDGKIGESKSEMNNCKDEKGILDSKKYLRAKRKFYDSLMLKDIWLRKFMNKLGLYLKETEWDPSKAIYGGYK